MDVLIFIIEGQQYGLDLKKIKSAALAVETTQLPNSSGYILGTINVHGNLLPVIKMRKFLGLQERELATEDQFILCEINNKEMVLWVDQIKGVKNCQKEDFRPAQEVLPNTKNLQYVLKDGDTFVLMYDLERAFEQCV